MRIYRVNEIFYSLQGEGRNTGRAAIFVRFAGCDLRCPFCDTEFDSYQEMTAQQILDAITPYPARFVVLTGGEPTLQVDENFVDLLHQHGFEAAMESNGTRPAPVNLDWLAVSPKVQGARYEVRGARIPDEIKIVFEEDTDPKSFLETRKDSLTPRNLYLQPCDTGNPERNARIMKACTDYIMQHPQWRLSLQTHKLINIK
jgi:organic radical activating enzyme